MAALHQTPQVVPLPSYPAPPAPPRPGESGEAYRERCGPFVEIEGRWYQKSLIEWYQRQDKANQWERLGKRPAICGAVMRPTPVQQAARIEAAQYGQNTITRYTLYPAFPWHWLIVAIGAAAVLARGVGAI